MINLIIKDFKKLLTSPGATLGMMSIPLIIALMLGAAFGGQSSGTPKVTLALENNDDSWVASFYAGAFTREELKDLFDVRVVQSNARALVERNEVSAAIVIPESFGTNILNGEPTSITVIKNPARQISPIIAEKTVEIMNMTLSQLRMVLATPLDRIMNATLNSDDQKAEDQEVAAIAVMISQEMNAIGDFVFPLSFELETVKAQPEEITEEEDEDVNIYLFFFPGLIIFGVFFVAEAYMSDLLEEKRVGTLNRILTAGVSPLKILSAKVTGCVLYCLLSILLMRIIGWLLFDVGWGSPVAELLTLTSTCLALTGIMSVVFGLAPNERQGSVISTIVVLSMSLIGGSMFPRRMMPVQIKKPGMLTPNYWSLEALDAMLIDHAGVAELIQPVLILLATGVVTILLGTLLLSRKLHGEGAIQ